MDAMKEYAEQWDSSGQYFYGKGYYKWMSKHVADYMTVVEVGCGTGYSTLALVEEGHRVIAVEKNNDCIEKAKRLLEEKGKSDQVVFIFGDIAEEDLREEIVSNYQFDVVICWNVGTYWSREMMEYYLPHMLEYGLNRYQIRENPESSYGELIIWETCRLASQKGVPVHLIDRCGEEIQEITDNYYVTLKDEFNYQCIEYDNEAATTVSGKGRVLTVDGQPDFSSIMNIILASITIK